MISDSKYHLEQNLNQVFLKNNNEAIWQLEPSNNGTNTGFGSLLQGLLFYGGPTIFAPITLNDSLFHAYAAGDLRKTSWIASIVGSNGKTYYYPYKYKLSRTGAAPGEYCTVLRLSEQYLIRAEARAQQNNVDGSEDDLNVVRHRAGLSEHRILNQQEALTAIYHEKTAV